MTVQDIINSVSIDTRQVLTAAGNDANVILNWVDRVQKDVLHSSLYVNQNLATTQVTTAVGTNAYSLTPPTNIRRIVGVFDLTFNMSLKPSDADLDQPSPTAAAADESQGRPFMTAVSMPPHQAYQFGGLPEYFRFIAPVTLIIRPAPATAAYVSTLSVTYEKQVANLVNTTDVLAVPDDGKDVIVAGVNWMAFAYIGRAQEAAAWFQLFQQLKGGTRTGVIR